MVALNFTFCVDLCRFLLKGFHPTPCTNHIDCFFADRHAPFSKNICATTAHARVPPLLPGLKTIHEQTNTDNPLPQLPFPQPLQLAAHKVGRSFSLFWHATTPPPPPLKIESVESQRRD